MPSLPLMQAFIQKEQEALQSVDVDVDVDVDVHELVVRATGPEHPNLDLVDMPGLVQAPGCGEPDDLPCQTRALLAQVEARDTHTLCLVALKATQAPNTSSAMAFVHEQAQQRRTCGVFTFCDELTEKPKDRLVQWVVPPVRPKAHAPALVPALVPVLSPLLHCPST